METGERPKCDVCAAVDVHYLKTGGARAAAVLAADAAFAHVLAERTAVVPRVPPYITVAVFRSVTVLQLSVARSRRLVVTFGHLLLVRRGSGCEGLEAGAVVVPAGAGLVAAPPC
jgi:deoxyinosine 3'endonuclease (endonuclease V)